MMLGRDTFVKTPGMSVAGSLERSKVSTPGDVSGKAMRAAASSRDISAECVCVCVRERECVCVCV